MKIKKTKITTLLMMLLALAFTTINVSCDSSTETDVDRCEAMPASFPDIVPVYSPNCISTISKNTITGQVRFIIGFTTTSSQQEVVDFYLSELNSNGWEIQEQGSTDSRWGAKNGDMYIIVNVVGAGNGAVFTITAPEE